MVEVIPAGSDGEGGDGDEGWRVLWWWGLVFAMTKMKTLCCDEDGTGDLIFVFLFLLSLITCIVFNEFMYKLISSFD